MTAAPDTRLTFLLNTGQRAVERWIEGQASTQAGLTAAQAGVLFYLSRNDGALIGDVAQALRIGAPSMSGLADRMARAGLLERRRDSVDGRAIRLFQTDAGRTAAQGAKSVLAALNAQLHEGFSEAEIALVARWLDSLQTKFPDAPTNRAD